MTNKKWRPGRLVLENGAEFIGKMPAWQQEYYFGELVFTTGMSGYVESLTDPSFAGQILNFTYPLIGNYGVGAAEEFESEKIHARGVIVAEAVEHFSHHAAERGLINWLEDEKIPLLCEIDTRRLTRLLRSRGDSRGVIMPLESPIPAEFPDPNLSHLVKTVVSPQVRTLGNGPHKVIAVDCGMKQNILRHLQTLPLEVKVVPFDYDFSAEEFDGLFLSNGPGDPERCVETIANVQKVLAHGKPIFGICLGIQILALAIGAKTYKLPYGHRGLNQPCIEVATERALLTSQNHGYAVDERSLPQDWRVSYRHLNDNSVAGIEHTKLPYFAVQFHPEAAPGPEDSHFLFKQFYEAIINCKQAPPQKQKSPAAKSDFQAEQQVDIFADAGEFHHD